MEQTALFEEMESDLLERIRLCMESVKSSMENYKETEEGCWEFQGAITTGGYGQAAIYNKNKIPKQRLIKAHRLSYALHNGVDPAEKFVCHRCDNPCCINPKHLFLGTHKENMRDMVVKGRAASRAGEAHHACKLSSEDVKCILKDIESGKKIKDIAKSFEVTEASLSRIKSGTRWTSFTASLGYEPAKRIQRKKAAEPL